MVINPIFEIIFSSKTTQVVAPKKLIIIPKSNYLSIQREFSEKRIREIETFFELNGRIPSAKSKSKDERRLANWIKAQKRSTKNGTQSESDMDWLRELKTKKSA